ncbi:MAG: nitroreductase family deazaflavin-dependent oxidoreductase [Anaerolineales bacterium]|nr:nitroreductase family deazaflavin-dependent oxidoreductase [Anaerolineales bacterium]
MPEKIRDMRPPRGLARLAFRLPIWFYRLGLGGLLGTRFLLLTHTGRRSGLPRRTVLEVVRCDRETNTFVVAAGFGPGSDWYRNVGKEPRVTVRCGRQTWKMVATFLTPAQAGEELVDYAHRHPIALGELARFMGYRLDGSAADVRALGELLPMIALHPEIKK